MAPDIFISYAREDQARIGRLSRALEAEGFSVWWDRDIAGGAEFTKETEAKLNEAKAIVVAWSKASVSSMWVADEATVGRAKGNLVPVVIDDVEPKLGFRQIQTIDLKSWHGEHGAPAFQALVRSLKARVAAEPAAPVASRAPPRFAARLRKHAVPLGAAAIAAVAVSALLIFLFVDRAPFVTPPSAAPQGEEGGPLHLEEPTAQGAEGVTKDGVGLAVLPFTNLSSDPEQEHFADGLTEELLNWLGNVEGLNVPGRTSSFQFKDTPDDLRAIGEALNVDYLLEGSVRRSGEALRITAQLIEAETGFHLWSETYDRKLDDIFAIQDEIARIVVTELLGKIPETGAANPAAVGDVDPHAHELYLEGRALWAQRQPDALDKFRAAVAIDPRHALAQAYVAILAAYLHANGIHAPNSSLDLGAAAAAALAEAVRISPDSADVLFAQGWVAEMSAGALGGDHANPLVTAFYERAVRANPRHVEALHALARSADDPQKGIELLQDILAIDPALEPASVNLVGAYVQRGERQKAISVARQMMAAAPDGSRVPPALAGRHAGDIDLAGEALFADWEATERDQFSRWVRASFLASLGAVDEARFLYAQEAAIGGRPWSQLARINAATLEGDAAGWLRAAVDMHETQTPPEFSAWVLANAHIANADYQRAYAVLIERRSDLADGPIEVTHGLGSGYFDVELLTAAHALHLTGRREQARVLWEAALAAAKSEPATNWGRRLNLALLHANLGDPDSAAASFRASYDAGFRYLSSFACDACVLDGFYAEHGLMRPLTEIPQIAALVAQIEAENAASLEDFNKRYGVLDRVREMMAAEAASD